MLTVFLLSLFAFFTTATSQEDNGICQSYWLLFDTIWLELRVFKFITSRLNLSIEQNRF